LSVDLPPVDDRALWDLWLSQLQLPVVLVSDELGIFSFLDRTPATAEKVAEHTSMPLRGVDVLLSALAASGFVVKHKDKFHLTNVAQAYLLPESHFYWIPMLRDVGQGRHLAGVLMQMVRSDHLEPDSRVSIRWEQGGITADDAHRANANFHAHSFPAAIGMARAIDFSGVRRMLDVAGGGGSFAIALALQYPSLQCTIADLPNVVPDTQGYIKRYKCEDRVATHAFNMFDDPWPDDHDGIFFSNIFHDWDPQRRRDLAEKAYAALPVGGRVFIHEMLLSDSADGPLTTTLFSVLMLGTRGKQFSYRELHTLLSDAGFKDVGVQHSYGYYSVVSGTKA
jgi:acetylserotonin N-methyltransferase